MMLSQNVSHSTSTIEPKSHKFERLVIKSQINQAKFPVLLALSPSLNKHFALKIFPYENGRINRFFMNEARFIGLDHPNVIATVHCEHNKIIPSKDSRTRVSYTVMELAPYGDFFDVLMTKKIKFNDALARTYFHQLIEGLEYLHSNGVAHLDIKPENLLVGNDFQLKIADFDHSSLNGNVVVPSSGTKFYRAPEIDQNEACIDPIAADVYSSAIMLFLFKSGGFLPHLENNLYEGINLFELLNNNNTSFWDSHCKIQDKAGTFFEPEFRELFNSMTKINPQERATIEELKASEWYNGPTYDNEELVSLMVEQLDV